MANIDYVAAINRIAANISATLIDFNTPREKGRMPTQASSEFITNREQGDWAEDLVHRAINESNLKYVAVKYGKSEKRVTGEVGFEKFFLEYQQELDTIGKRPDILIFDRSHYQEQWNYDISGFPLADLTDIVPQAMAGIEIRSSSFLYEKYNHSQEQESKEKIQRIMKIREKLLNQYKDILISKVGWIKIIEDVSPDTVSIVKFKAPGWAATQRTKEAGMLIRDLKKQLSEYQKRNHLSITPKVEDIKVVTKWIQHYQVPHYYFQVFFDKVFGIAFIDILDLLADPSNEDVKYFMESDVKNQTNLL